MSLLKGITVYLTQRTQTGRDVFNTPVYEEQVVAVENVLVAPASDTEILDILNLTGKRAVYTLAIPKGDTHDWTGAKVCFFGETWRVIGHGTEGIGDNIPLDWNRKVQVESIVTKPV